MTSNERQKEALVLIASHLQAEGYHDVYALLKQKASFLERHSLAENIDLLSIVIDWTSSYEERFRRRPRIISRQVGVGDCANSIDAAADASAKGSASRKKQAAAARRRAAMQYGSSGTGQGAGSQQSAVLKQVENRLGVVGVGATDGASAATGNGTATCTIGIDENELTVPSVSGKSITTLSSEQEGENIVAIEDRLLKPLPSFAGDLELQALARSIQREIVQTNTGVKWDDIVGLDNTKRLLKEAVVIPLLYPSLFTGLLAPWRGCLLCGPPGTGKTLLARATAAETNATFFNITSASITSKFRGDSEKLVRVLFDLARYHSPSIIFFDEIDSIMGSRSGAGDGEGPSGGSSEHEGSRRTKAELLIQMDGLSTTEDNVFVLAASNLPWQLDPALLRRLEKRVLVALPSHPVRVEMLKSHFATLPAHSCQETDFMECAHATEGYSGADLHLLSKEAAMKPVRRILASIEDRSKKNERPHAPLSDDELSKLVKINPVTSEDLRDAWRSTNKSCGGEFSERYDKWMLEYGSA